MIKAERTHALRADALTKEEVDSLKKAVPIIFDIAYILQDNEGLEPNLETIYKNEISALADALNDLARGKDVEIVSRDEDEW